MSLVGDRIVAFIAAWEKEFGVTLTDSQARWQFERLVDVYKGMASFARSRDERDVTDVGDVAVMDSPAPETVR